MSVRINVAKATKAIQMNRGLRSLSEVATRAGRVNRCRRISACKDGLYHGVELVQTRWFPQHPAIDDQCGRRVYIEFAAQGFAFLDARHSSRSFDTGVE